MKKCCSRMLQPLSTCSGLQDPNHHRHSSLPTVPTAGHAGDDSIMDLLDTTDLDLPQESPAGSPRSSASAHSAITKAELFSREHTTAELPPCAPGPQPAPEHKADILVHCGEEATPPAVLPGLLVRTRSKLAPEAPAEEPLEAIQLTMDHRPGEPSEMGMPLVKAPQLACMLAPRPCCSAAEVHLGLLWPDRRLRLVRPALASQHLCCKSWMIQATSPPAHEIRPAGRPMPAPCLLPNVMMTRILPLQSAS